MGVVLEPFLPQLPLSQMGVGGRMCVGAHPSAVRAGFEGAGHSIKTHGAGTSSDSCVLGLFLCRDREGEECQHPSGRPYHRGKGEGVCLLWVHGESLRSHRDADVQPVALIACVLFAAPFNSSAGEKSLFPTRGTKHFFKATRVG